MRWKNSTEVGCSPSTFISTSDESLPGLPTYGASAASLVQRSSSSEEQLVQLRAGTASSSSNSAERARMAVAAPRYFHRDMSLVTSTP